MERERENSEKMATGAAKLFGLSELPHKKKKEQLDIKTKHQTSVTNLQKKKKHKKPNKPIKKTPRYSHKSQNMRCGDKPHACW